MKRHDLILAAGIALWPAEKVALLAADRPSPWEKSVVSIEASRKQYDYLQPWSRRMETVSKCGVVVGPRQVLTTAEYLNDTTLIRVQKGGRGMWAQAELLWIDYHANLALVTSPETNFWTGLRVVSFVEPTPARGPIEVVRWRNGQLQRYKGDINRLTVRRGKLTQVEHLHAEVNSEIGAAGWAEPVTKGSRLIGLACSQDGNVLTLLPSSFIHPILKARRAGAYAGLGYFDFVWQKAENPATLAYLKLAGNARGVIVVEGGRKPGFTSPILAKDILLKIDGFEIDSEGDYQDPTFGKLSLEHLGSGRKWAGDSVRISLWREGRLMEVDYPLPKAAYDELIPRAVFDQEPEYLIAGGLVFQPLTEAYLRSWGSDWRRKAPFRLVYYTQEKPTPDRPARVILSMVLPDRFNIGYQDYRFLVVDRINNQAVSRLEDVVSALAAPRDGYHVVEFAAGESVQKLVLEASQMNAANTRLLRDFGIQKDRHLGSPPAGAR
jgi:hypothetical protein